MPSAIDEKDQLSIPPFFARWYTILIKTLVIRIDAMGTTTCATWVLSVGAGKGRDADIECVHTSSVNSPDPCV